MTKRASFNRKIAYLVGIVALAIPIFLLSTPATQNSKGGKLAQLREEHHLGQANLGDVDPASETMRFLTLGLRGVAVTALWEKANHYKKVEDWTNLTATLEQLAKLQPNFVTFWKYQAWNLTYNVSVEFDDYHDRYYYVIRGIKFLKEGERYNADNPQLLSDLGWFIGHKIGRADEHVQYRRLFKNDPDFHPADRTPDERDNWLVSKGWYQRSIDAVDFKHKTLVKKSPREFYSDPAKAQINYAEAISEEGAFAKAQRAWIKGGEEWRQFGRLPIAHSSGVMLRMGDQPRLTQEVEQLRKELDQFGPDVRGKIAEEKRKELSDTERELVDTPADKIDPAQANERYTLESRLHVTDREVAERLISANPANEKQVSKLVRRLEDVERELRYTTSYKEIVNFDYWQLRCDFEQTDNAIAARELVFQARTLARGGDEVSAIAQYKEGFAKWRQVLDAFPALMEDDTTFGDDLIQTTKRYREVLDSQGELLDESFPLWDALEKFDKEKVFADDVARHRQAVDENEKAVEKKKADEKEKSPDAKVNNIL